MSEELIHFTVQWKGRQLHTTMSPMHITAYKGGVELLGLGVLEALQKLDDSFAHGEGGTTFRPGPLDKKYGRSMFSEKKEKI